MNMSSNPGNGVSPTLGITDHASDKLADRAENAIRSTQQAATHALDQLAGAVQVAHDNTVPRLERLGTQAEALTRRGFDAAQHGSQQLRDAAQRRSDQTVGYIRDEPIRSVLIAAAVGAVLMGLVSMFGRSSRQPR